MGGTKFIDYYNEFDVERAINAVLFCGNYDDAVGALKGEGITTTVGKLRVMCESKSPTGEKYQQRREELAPVLEGIFANDLLDNARRGAMAVQLAIEKTHELLASGSVRDPSRIARDLSQVMTQAIDKRMAIQGRPTQIIEHRDVNEIVRALQGMGVVSVDATVEEPPALEERNDWAVKP